MLLILINSFCHWTINNRTASAANDSGDGRAAPGKAITNILLIIIIITIITVIIDVIMITMMIIHVIMRMKMIITIKCSQ